MFKILQITSTEVPLDDRVFSSNTLSVYWLNRIKLFSLNNSIKPLNLVFSFASLNNLFLVFKTDKDISPVRFLSTSACREITPFKEIYTEIHLDYLEDVVSFFLDITKKIDTIKNQFNQYKLAKENSLYGGWINFTKNTNINWYDGKRTTLLNGVYMASKERTRNWLSRLLFGGLLVATLTGCGPLLTELLPHNPDPPTAAVAEQQLHTFKDLLDQGWEIKVYKGKVVLVKYSDNGLLINDVFKVLEGE